MKVINKEIKECDEKDWTKVTVLDLQYTHRWEEWRILIRDYSDDFYDDILKQLRKAVRNNYTEQKLKA